MQLNSFTRSGDRLLLYEHILLRIIYSQWRRRRAHDDDVVIVGLALRVDGRLEEVLDYHHALGYHLLQGIRQKTSAKHRTSGSTSGGGGP
jgi:hypothetical protein